MPGICPATARHDESNTSVAARGKTGTPRGHPWSCVTGPAIFRSIALYVGHPEWLGGLLRGRRRLGGLHTDPRRYRPVDEPRGRKSEIRGAGHCAGVRFLPVPWVCICRGLALQSWPHALTEESG